MGTWNEYVPETDGAAVTRNYIESAGTIEIQLDFAKNTTINTQSAAVTLTRPTSPVLMYLASCRNPSIDSDLTCKLWNRRTFSETGTAQAADATHITLAATANPTNDHYNGFVITILTGTGAGQTRTISDYVGATCIAEVANWTTPPDATSTYSIAIIRDCLVKTLTFTKASLTAPIVYANDSEIITGLFSGGATVYATFTNTTAIANADASRFTIHFQLIPVA